MVRLSYQHRAFYCYVILSVWIFLLVAGKEKRKKEKKKKRKERVEKKNKKKSSR
jgi:large-conductance mechanosensitive channel